MELLDYVVGRFGHVASFTSTYRANSWILNIERRHTQGTVFLVVIPGWNIKTTVTVHVFIFCVRGVIYFAKMSPY